MISIQNASLTSRAQNTRFRYYTRSLKNPYDQAKWLNETRITLTCDSSKDTSTIRDGGLDRGDRRRAPTYAIW